MYDSPFPDDSFKAGVRQFPTLVPTMPDDPAALVCGGCIAAGRLVVP